MVLEILGGKDPSTLPLRTNPALAYYVDYKAMQRWGLRESDLPAGTIVRFKPPGIWQEHRDLVLAALAVFALQTAFAGALLVQRHRRRRAELLLKESEERMTFTAASVNIGLWQFNPETHELWATEHCRTLFGLARDVPLTRDNFLKAVHPEDRERAISSLRTAATQDRPAVHDVRVVQPDGGIRWVRVRARAHPDSRGAPRQLSGIFVDMTAQKAAEAEASLRRQEVTHLMRVSALGELSGAIAHEVNQPLTAIQSNAETGLDLLSADRPDLAELGDVLRDIASDNQRASAVIQRLRNLLQKNEGSFEPVDLNQLARSTCALLNSEMIGRKIDVKFDLTGALPETFGDPVQLQQVLLNLVMNAMDAMTSTPAAQRLVTISTRATGLGTIELQVIDRGIGISLPDESRLFQAFHTTKAHGLGLGLSICSTIIQAHGGHLTLVNGEAGGAVATFSLPAHVMAVAAK
jgi:PAS domain S-box-containing protein